MGSNPAGRTKPITCAEVKAERRHSAADQEAWRLAVQHTFQCRVPASIALVARSGFCTISGAVAWSNGVPKSADFGTCLGLGMSCPWQTPSVPTHVRPRSGARTQPWSRSYEPAGRRVVSLTCSRAGPLGCRDRDPLGPAVDRVRTKAFPAAYVFMAVHLAHFWLPLAVDCNLLNLCKKLLNENAIYKAATAVKLRPSERLRACGGSTKVSDLDS